jgi:hypothetical protein
MPRPTMFARFVNTFFRLQEPAPYQGQIPELPGPAPVQLHVTEIGASGTDIQSGYYQEEYLPELTGRPAADVYDKMRRADAKIKMALSAVKSPLKKATWDIEKADETPEAEKIAEFCKFILFEDMGKTWSEFLGEATSVIDFGHAVFEKTHKAVVGHPTWGNYNGIKSLGFRSQRTIERWHLNPDGQIRDIEQFVYGDLERRVLIPGAHLVKFALDKEGDNYEGISMLRAAYGAWWRKNLYLRLSSAGFERAAIKTPVLKYPQGQQNSDQFAKAYAALQVYMSHQNSALTLPEGYEVVFLDSDFDADKAVSLIEFENKEIVHAFVANFLALGQDGKGSYSLSFDLSDFFLSTVEFIGEMMCDELNRAVIKDIVDLNFGPQEKYPRLTCTGISDKAGKELAEIIQILLNSHAITAGPELEDNLRQRYGLPEKPEGQEEPSPDQVEETPEENEDAEAEAALDDKPEEKTNQLSEVIQLAETPKKLISKGSEELLELMRKHLKTIADALILKTVKRWKAGEKEKAIRDNSTPGYSDYLSAMQDFFADVSDVALDQARKEVPSKKNLKLADINDRPSKLRRRLKGQSNLVVDSQIADLEKAIYFQYLSSMDLDSESMIAQNLSEAADKYIASASVTAASGNTVAQVVNQSRSEFFDTPEVSDEIESYTFVNGDPQSEICSALAGTVFSPDDPDVLTYQPPLHHNCKSIMAPNLKGNKNPEPTEKDKAWRKEVAGAQDSITLADFASGPLAIQSIRVDKKLALTADEAKKFAQEFYREVNTMTVLEDSYRFEVGDLGLFIEGTLRTFCPIEGLTVVIGRLNNAML